MKNRTPTRTRLRPLCAVVLSLFGSDALAAHFVTSCADDGSPGTLRSQVTAAQGSSDIDFDLHTQLPLGCSTITLTQGQIGPATARMIGPTDRTLVLAGNGSDRVLDLGYGRIENLTVRGGRLSTAPGGTARGGCIRTDQLYLVNSTVTDCQAGSDSAAQAYGGAIYSALGPLHLINSHVTDSRLKFGAPGNSAGGGIYARGSLYCQDSSISHNTSDTSTFTGFGGGVYGHFDVHLAGCTLDSNVGLGLVVGPHGIVDIKRSTISGNQRGGIGSAVPVTIVSSTISGNRNGPGVGAPLIRAYNSTIVFNEGGGANTTGNIYAQSSIIAENTGYDVYVSNDRNMIYGADNFITNINLGQLPPGTIVAGDNPHLAPLAYHGGSTRTHALLASSSAINLGNNGAMSATDQRGAPREAPSGKPDIGAYERQPGDDEIFYDGFDLAP